MSRFYRVMRAISSGGVSLVAEKKESAMCEDKKSQIQELAEKYARAYADARKITEEATNETTDSHFAALEAMRLAAK